MNCLHRERQFAEADLLARQLLDVSRRVFGPENSRTAEAQYEIGALLALEDRRDEAIDALAEALKHGLGRDKLLAIETDADLKSLRDDTRFKAIVVDAKRRANSKAG